MRFAVESWAPEYGVGADENRLEETTAEVDVEFETAEEDWAPIAPDASVVPESIAFVDGVRRIDARVWLTRDELVRPGVCASVAAGVVLCRGNEARVADLTVHRGLYAIGDDDTTDVVTSLGSYEFVACDGDGPDDLYRGIHDQMTKLETRIAVDDEVGLVVFDGPLRGRNDPRAVGFVKTQHVQYLPDDLQRIVGRLGAGERTPVFHISGGGFPRLSWYLRLPGPMVQPLSGIVRCELPAAAAKTAVERANEISAALPRFASEPHKDARAPQNLYPIAGLEHELRHRLGDALVLERALRSAADHRGVR